MIPLLQYSDSADAPSFIVIISISAVILLISIVITRAVFSISRFLKYQKAQTMLLLKIARRQGVAEADIENVVELLDPTPDRYPLRSDFNIRQLDNYRDLENK